jgi:predicted lipid carrier protein YhbT
MMTGDPDAFEADFRVGWDLLLLAARRGNRDAIAFIEDGLVEGDEDLGLAAQPEIASCLSDIIRDVNGNDIVEPALVESCLERLVLPE